MINNSEVSPVLTQLVDVFTSRRRWGPLHSTPRDTHKQLDFFHYILPQPRTVATSDLLLPLNQAARTAAPTLVTQHWSQRATFYVIPQQQPTIGNTGL
jgi:hypothetical protein